MEIARNLKISMLQLANILIFIMYTQNTNRDILFQKLEKNTIYYGTIYNKMVFVWLFFNSKKIKKITILKWYSIY